MNALSVFILVILRGISLDLASSQLLGYNFLPIRGNKSFVKSLMIKEILISCRFFSMNKVILSVTDSLCYTYVYPLPYITTTF